MTAPDTNQISEVVRQRFVGRTEALDIFYLRLAYRHAKNGVYYYGAGGLGKTWILKKIRIDNQDDPNLVVPGIIDFFDTRNHNIRGLQATIMSRLQVLEAFQPYNEAIKHLAEMRLEKEEVHPSMIASLETRINRLFITCCQQAIIGREVVLLFDTFERVQHQHVGQWLLKKFLPEVRGLIVVIAGRPTPLPARMPDNIVTYQLPGLNLEETKQHILKHPQHVSEEDVHYIWDHTGGVPLMLDLIFDLPHPRQEQFITELRTLKKGQLIQDTPELLRGLVRQFTRPNRQNRVIWAMAYLRRRFDVNILKYIVTKRIWFQPGDYEEIFDELSQSVYVKEYPEQQSHLLHDEAQRIVSEYVLSETIDPWQEMREPLYELIVNHYYPDAIVEAEKDKKKELARQLRTEQLGYILDHTPEDGFKKYTECRSEVERITHDYDFEELLWGEVNEYLGKFKKKTASFKLTEQSFEDLRNEKIPEDILENLKPLKYKEITGEGKFLDAVKEQIGEEQTVRYEELILKHANKAYQICLERVGWLRKHNLFQRAEELARQMVTQFPKRAVKTREWLGFMLMRQGKMTEAEQFLRENRSFIQDNEFSSIATVENTLGQLMYLSGRWEEAFEHYAKSFRAATLAHDDSYMASVYLNRGFLYSLQGLYDNAKRQCQSALELVQSLPETSENIQRAIYAWMNLGTAYRHSGDYAKADEYYQKSLELADKHNNWEAICNAFQQIGINAHLWGRKLHRDLWGQKLQPSFQVPLLPEQQKNLTEACQHQLHAWHRLTEALDIARKADWLREIAHGLGRLAMVYREVGRLENLISYTNQSIETPEDFKVLQHKTKTYRLSFEVEYEHELLTPEHFEQLDTWMDRAIRLFDVSALIADEANDFHRALDSLVELSRIFTEQKMKDPVPIVIRRIERIKGYYYQEELFAAMNEITWGDLDLIEGRFEAALEKYKKAYADVAERSGYASYLLTDRLRDLEWHLRELSPEMTKEWCDKLEDAWLERSISTKRPDMLDLLERIRVDVSRVENL